MLFFLVLFCFSWRVDSLQVHPVKVLEFQFAGKCFQSSYPARGVMIVPENRVAMAPRD